MWMKIFLSVSVVCVCIIGANGFNISEINSDCEFKKGSNCPGQFNVTTNCSVTCDGILEDYEIDGMGCYNSCACIFHKEKCAERDIRVGDLNRDMMNYLYKNKSGSGPSSRGLTSISRYFWPDDDLDGLYSVPYVNNVLDSNTVTGLNAAIADFNSMTCIRLIPRTTETNYINIISDGGCYSYIGRVGGQQNLSLGNNCHFKEVILHEVMHALGFHHEQSRPDRDSYVTIVSANILTGFEGNFAIASNINSRGSPYDYRSLMHYGKRFFSKDRNTLDTIQTTNTTFQNVIGTGTEFSVQDLFQINAAYSCSQSPTTEPITTDAITSTASSTVASTTTEALEVTTTGPTNVISSTTTPWNVTSIPTASTSNVTINTTGNYDTANSTSSSSKLSALTFLAVCPVAWWNLMLNI